MTLKRIIMVMTACSFFLTPLIARAQYFDTGGDDNAVSASYDELTPQEQHAVNSSFVADVNRSDEQAPQYSYHYQDDQSPPPRKPHRVKTKRIAHSDDDFPEYNDQLPRRILTTEKVIIVDPIIHKWAAYSSEGKLIRAGLATAGSKWCSDIGRGCKTKSGTFRIYSLGDGDCISSKYPINEGGGAPMPYCMYFNGSQGLHGSNQVVAGNVSHGCVRLREGDARWIRYNFATRGTKVIVKPY